MPTVNLVPGLQIHYTRRSRSRRNSRCRTLRDSTMLAARASSPTGAVHPRESSSSSSSSSSDVVANGAACGRPRTPAATATRASPVATAGSSDIATKSAASAVTQDGSRCAARSKSSGAARAAARTVQMAGSVAAARSTRARSAAPKGVGGPRRARRYGAARCGSVRCVAVLFREGFIARVERSDTAD